MALRSRFFHHPSLILVTLTAFIFGCATPWRMQNGPTAEVVTRDHAGVRVTYYPPTDAEVGQVVDIEVTRVVLASAAVLGDSLVGVVADTTISTTEMTDERIAIALTDIESIEMREVTTRTAGGGVKMALAAAAAVGLLLLLFTQVGGDDAPR